MVKKIQAMQVMGTICQHQVAQLRTIKQDATDCKHAQGWYAFTVNMTSKTCINVSCSEASRLHRYKPCKKLIYVTGLGLSEIRETNNISINMPFTQQ